MSKGMRWRDMADETRDGVMLELALMSNPKLKARREAWYASVREFREETAHKTRAEMIDELITHNPAYIRSLLEGQHESVTRDRYVMTFHKIKRAKRAASRTPSSCWKRS